MRKHAGMRPQDIVILLKIALIKDKNWQMKDLADDLFISKSEISESLNRSNFAGLIASDKKSLIKYALMDFLQFGFKYVFPSKPSEFAVGIPTAFSAKPLSNHITSTQTVVWKFGKGKFRGQSLQPLHPSVPKACLKDKALHEILALTDAIRIGRVREQNFAIDFMKAKLIN